MIGVLLTLVLYIIVFGLLWWLVQYLLGLFPLPDPAPRVIQAILAIILVLFLIGVLAQAFGVAETGFPVLRWR
jgi:hypothetical protein